MHRAKKALAKVHAKSGVAKASASGDTLAAYYHASASTFESEAALRSYLEGASLE